MNKQDKDWIFSKIDTLRIISKGINDTIEFRLPDLLLSSSMVLWLDNFIKEIHEKIGIKL